MRYMGGICIIRQILKDGKTYSVPQLEIFILEFGPINAFATSPVVVGEVSSLTHELRDHPGEEQMSKVVESKMPWNYYGTIFDISIRTSKDQTTHTCEKSFLCIQNPVPQCTTVGSFQLF